MLMDEFIFLRPIRDMIKLAQCDKIPVDSLGVHIPHHMLNVGEDDWMDLPTIFSNTSCDAEDYEDE
jgi:hypothetical protein